MARSKEGHINVLLADDHVILLDSLCMLLEAEGDLKVVARVTDGNDAVRAARQLNPDVAILDIAMPGLNGIEAARAIRKASPSTRILILSMHDSAHYIYQSFQAGADGYLVKESAGAEMVDAVRLVNQGKRYIAARIAGAVIDELVRNRSALNGPLGDLSERECQILRLIVEGKTSAQAGKALNLSRKTVETYRSRLMQKLGMQDLPALVKFAIKHGLTTIP
jgi:DNA-binding NarL/FixJ family response regulator